MLAGMDENFGQRLRALRMARGLGQKELGHAVGRSESWVSNVEKGKIREPGSSAVLALARALKVSVEELTGRVAQSEADNGFDGRELREVVAYLESQPELLATLEQVRRENTPETYRRFVMSLARAWESNLRMALTLLAAREGESG